MQVIRVNPSGYCHGVTLAIQKVKDTIVQYPNKQIYILGMIVHNQYVVDAFSNLNVITLNGDKLKAIDQINDGIVIFTAHGISKNIKQKVIDKGLQYVDASCPNVLVNQRLISKYLNDGFDVIYLGVKNHQESDAVISLSNKVHLVENISDIDNLNINNEKILLTNQTTTSIDDLKDIIDYTITKYPKTIVTQEICPATRLRQNAVKNLKDIDTLIVVGDPKSNNTKQLSLISNAKNVILVKDSGELKDVSINSDVVYITAGASTPELLVNNCINYLKTKDEKYLHNDINEVL